MIKSVHLKVNRFCLYVTGIWTIKPEDSQFYISKLHVVYSHFITAYFAIFVASQIVEIFNIIGEDIYYLVANLGVSLLYCGCLVKIAVCRGPTISKLTHQIEEKEKKILNSDDDIVKNIYIKTAKYNYFVGRGLVYTGVITMIPFYLDPVLREIQNPPNVLYDVDNFTIVYRPRPLPFSSWFPFDRYKYYYVSYAFHILSGTIGASLTCTTDILFYGMMIYAIGQIKILQHYLKNFKLYAKIIIQQTNCSMEKAIDTVVDNGIKEHRVIIEYVKDLDSCMRLLMLLDFMLTSMQMAMIGFQLIVVGLSFQQAFALEYLVAMLFQLFLFYWHANEIRIESTQIANAIWESDWFDCKTSVKRTFLHMMMRSSKPLTLSVGPFYAMSNQTALSILRAAYSYVALLRQSYMRK